MGGIKKTCPNCEGREGGENMGVRETVLRQKLQERGYYDIVLGRAPPPGSELVMRHIEVQPDGTVKAEARPPQDSYRRTSGAYGPPQTYKSIEEAVEAES